MKNKPAFQTFSRIRPVLISRRGQFPFGRQLPAVPVLPETLLRLELEASEPAVDLRRFTEIVLRDLGATIQVLRLAGVEYNGSESPIRVSDCIADLGVHACLEAMTVRVCVLDYRAAWIAAAYSHAVEIAECAQEMAEAMPDVDPEQAYLAALLQGMGSLPRVLDWNESVYGRFKRTFTAVNLASHWFFPPFVLDLLRAADATGPWAGIVREAHRLACRYKTACPLQHRSIPVRAVAAQGAVGD